MELDVDCPHCSAANTLTKVRVEPNGVLVCLCSCCAKLCRVNAEGAVIHTPDKRDVNGTVMDGGD